MSTPGIAHVNFDMTRRDFFGRFALGLGGVALTGLLQRTTAAESPFAGRPLYREMPQLFADIEVHRLPGGHHCHLEGAEAAIAERIRTFFARRA